MSMNKTTEEMNFRFSSSLLELDVNNRPGVMSLVVGLFSRRAYNLEGILCLPVTSKTSPAQKISRIWLFLNEDTRLDQIVRQLEKLEDVICVRHHMEEPATFKHLGHLFEEMQVACAQNSL